MSYDLFFRSRTSTPLAETALLAYFRERPNYRCTDNQAWYENEKTGVYFSFDVGATEADAEIGENPAPVAFNVNFFRPHVFGLEAEPELTAFVRRFDLLVSDPQTDGMGDGEYSPGGFLRGWNHGNEFGYKAMLSQEAGAAPHTMPAAIIETVWRWNYSVVERQNAIGESAYVPTVFFFDVAGTLRTGVVWGDAIPILLPRVDVVMAPRQELAPRRLLRRAEDTVLFGWGDLEPLVSRFPRDDAGALPAYRLFYDDPPNDVAQLFRGKPANVEPIKGRSLDQVLDQEIVDRAR